MLNEIKIPRNAFRQTFSRIVCRCGRNYVFHEKPWRISFNNVAKKLGLTRGQLNKLRKSEVGFPAAMKDSDSRQGPIYFDLKEIEEWMEKNIEINRVN